MASFLLALLLVGVLSLGARDQWLVARWADGLGQRASLLLVAIAAAAFSAALMAWAGAGLAALLPPRAARMLVAAALAIAAFELGWPVRQTVPREPTRSLGAIFIVLAARQVGDAARFTVLALAAAAHLPAVAALGGAVGGAAALALGWALGASGLVRWPLRGLRRGLGLCLILAALFIGLNARYAAV
ncbi:MAG: hypothetical protein GC147_03310 [Porphyrobacter sp.]|nr:hypothetical protein [Porphyrobacter sp.]